MREGAPGLHLTSAFSNASMTLVFLSSSNPSTCPPSARSPTTFMSVPSPSAAATRTGSPESSSALMRTSTREASSGLGGGEVASLRERTSHLIVSALTEGFLSFAYVTTSSAISPIVACAPHLVSSTPSHRESSQPTHREEERVQRTSKSLEYARLLLLCPRQDRSDDRSSVLGKLVPEPLGQLLQARRRQLNAHDIRVRHPRRQCPRQLVVVAVLEAGSLEEGEEGFESELLAVLPFRRGEVGVKVGREGREDRSGRDEFEWVCDGFLDFIFLCPCGGVSSQHHRDEKETDEPSAPLPSSAPSASLTSLSRCCFLVHLVCAPFPNPSPRSSASLNASPSSFCCTGLRSDR